MNVLMLAPEFTPIRGGVGTYVLEISRHVSKATNIHILAPEDVEAVESSTEAERIGMPENVTVHRVATPKFAFLSSLSFQLSCRKAIASMLAEEEIDLIHSQSAMPDLFISPKKIGAPILTTVHSTIEGHCRTLKTHVVDRGELTSSERLVLELGPLLKVIEDRYYTSDRSYLTVSEWGKNELAREKGIELDSIRVVPNGVDSQRFNPCHRDEALRQYAELNDIEEPMVLFLSRLAMRKGIRQFLRAIPKVLSKVDAHFIIAGSGKVPNSFRPSKQCTVLGHVPHADTPGIFAFSDVFVLPSLSENMPLSVLEAMASETAVVASEIGGVPEIIDQGRNGVLVRPGDCDELADAIVKLLESDDLRTAVAKEGRHRVVNEFSWQVAAARTEECYRELLA